MTAARDRAGCRGTIPGVLVFSALLLVLLTGCGSDAPEPSASDDDLVAVPPLRIGVSTSLLATPVRLAAVLDRFAAHDVDVELIFTASGKAALAQLLAGRVDVSTTADAPIMQAAMDGEEFAVLATFIATDAHGEVAGRRSLGIETPLDLAGKRIGLDLNTTADFFLQVFLIEAGVDLDTIEVVDIPTQRLVEALGAAEVDAIATWQPNIYYAEEALGDDAVVFSTEDGMRQTFNLIALPDLVEQRRQDLLRLLAAVGEGAEYAREHPEQAQVLMAEQLGLPLPMVADIWGNYFFDLFLDQGLVLTLEAEARWYLRDRGEPDAPLPDFLDFIDPSLLRQLVPGSVTLTR